MCSVLNISRSTYYYELNKSDDKTLIDPITNDVIRVFKSNRRCYGTRRIREALRNEA